ncbi:efflux RND transporter permease subunit [bacterium]|nr:efflux RND transporter permease subunit [bacterium]
MIRASIGNPYAVAVGVLILVIFSVIAYTQIPVQLKPTVEPLEFNIDTNYPGASALEVEDQVTNRLERELASVNNLEELSSDSSEGRSRISLTFLDDADKNQAMLDVVQAVSRVRDLPDDAETPVISRANANGEQIMWIAVTGNADVNTMFDYVDQSISPALQRVEGVGGVLVTGGSQRRIIVEPDQDELSSRGITVSELGAALRTSNNDTLGGEITEGERDFTIRSIGKFQSLEDVRQAVVRHGPAGTVRVGDVAKVVDGRLRNPARVRINGSPGMSIRILKQAGANTLDTIDGCEAVLERFNQQFEQQKVGISLVVGYSDRSYVKEGIKLVWKDLLIGAVLAAIVLGLFLRAGRPILITVLSIPISLVSVFLILQALDRSVNIIALAGMAFAVGLVVDDAIVALENIERHMTELKKPVRQAAQEGLEEVWSAILSITLVRIAVFLPVVLSSTEAGLLFKDIAIAIVGSIFVSLLVTLTVVPAFAAIFLRHESGRKKLADKYPAMHRLLEVVEFVWLGEFVQQAYARFTRWACEGRGAAHNLGRLALLGAVLLLFLGSLLLLPAASYLPNGTQGFITARTQPLPGQNTQVTMDALLPMEKAAMEDERVSSVFLIVSDSFNIVGVRTHQEKTDEKVLQDIQNKLRKLGRTLPGFTSIQVSQRSIFRVQDKQFTLEVSGPDLNRLKQVAAEVERALKARDDIIGEEGSVRNSYVEGAPELQVRVDPLRVRELGMNVEEVAQVIKSMIAGTQFSSYNEGGREFDLVVQGAQDLVATRTDLAGLLIAAPGGRMLRLDELASIRESSGPTSVRHFNRERSIQLNVNTRPDVPTQISLQRTQEVLAPIISELPVGYSIEFGQAADKLRETFQSLIFQGILAVVIVYLLLVALFRSFYYPFVVLLTIPLAWSGSFLAISLAYKISDSVIQFDVLGMLGLIILSGIVAANAIMIIAQMINFEKEGLSPNEALRESASTRLRPIMMTVLAAVFGMLPLAFGHGSGSELYRGLGIIVVGGLISSTIFTLLVVPTMMSLVNDMVTALGRRRRPAQDSMDHA